MDRLSCHDLRRTWINLGASACGLDIIKVELLTNHMPQGVTQKHYLKTGDLRAYRREVQAIADYIEQQALIAAGGNVVALRASLPRYPRKLPAAAGVRGLPPLPRQRCAARL